MFAPREKAYQLDNIISIVQYYTFKKIYSRLTINTKSNIKKSIGTYRDGT